jgi:class 3 adenylate cyclase
MSVISAYHAAVATEVLRLEGFVARFMGDGVLAMNPVLQHKSRVGYTCHF